MCTHGVPVPVVLGLAVTLLVTEGLWPAGREGVEVALLLPVILAVRDVEPVMEGVAVTVLVGLLLGVGLLDGVPVGVITTSTLMLAP